MASGQPATGDIAKTLHLVARKANTNPDRQVPWIGTLACYGGYSKSGVEMDAALPNERLFCASAGVG